MRIQALRKQAFADVVDSKLSPVIKATKKPPEDWHIAFEEAESSVKEPRYFFIKTFTIPSSEYGTAFMARIRQAEQKLNHHCHEILTFPDNSIKITLTTHDAGTVTEKDVKLAELINLAYDFHKTNKAKE